VFDSEREVADVLDALHIAWEYEPKFFILCTDPSSGRVTMGFQPDFYLCKEDLYIEVTKAKQSLTTEKNRKARLLRELYPGVRVELIYRAHFADLKKRVLEILAD
jgi:bifunctional protein TilS/HprT